MSQFRTDKHRNPTAFTTDIAKEAGLQLGVAYVQGDPFTVPGSHGVIHTYFTAKLVGDPINTTIRVIDKVGFYNSLGNIRWIYIGLPYGLWLALTANQKTAVIGFMYGREGGSEMKDLFKGSSYGKSV